jgi:Icc-related predicted phosphoesterase
MKILAATDIHGDVDLVKNLVKKALKNKVDAVVLCGDLTMFSMEVEGLIKPFKEAGLKVLAIPGNHESFATLDFFSKFYKPNVINLDEEVYEHENIAFFGGSGTRMGVPGEPEKKIEKSLLEKGREVEGLAKRVMVVHEPPHNTKLDNIGFPAGSIGVRKAIEKLQPDLCLCGHMHETFGLEDRIKKTRVINVGREGIILEL